MTMSDYQQKNEVEALDAGPMRELKNLPAKMDGALEDFKQKIKDAKGNRRLSAEAQASDIHAARDEAHANLDHHAARADALARDVKERASVVAEAHQKAIADGLDQSLAARVWNRSQKLLDRGKSPLDVIEGESHTAPSLQVLAEELPSWMEASGYDEKTAKSMIEHLDQKRLEHAPAHVRRAHEMPAEAAELAQTAKRHGMYRSQQIYSGAVDQAARAELVAEGGYTQPGLNPGEFQPR